MSTLARINSKPTKFPQGYRPARPIIVAYLGEPDPRPVRDYATRERHAYIDSVDPFISKQERSAYFWRSLLAVVIGGPLPFERSVKV